MTPERYILGELPPDEREEFEDHMADCTVCMQEVAAADMFAANAAAVFADRKAAEGEKSSPRWFDFLRPRAIPALAFSGVLNLALLGLVGYGVTRMTLSSSRPQVSEVFTVHPPARSGEHRVCIVGKSKAFAILQFDLAHRYERYSYSLEGVGESSVDLSRSSAAETLSLAIPLAGLKPGDHKFELLGWNGQQNTPIGECVLRVDANQ